MDGRRNHSQVLVARWLEQLGRSLSSRKTGEETSDCPWCVWEGAGEEAGWGGREAAALQGNRRRSRRSAVGGVLGLLLPLSSLKSHPFISEGRALKIWVPGGRTRFSVFELKTSALLGKVGFQKA